MPGQIVEVVESAPAGAVPAGTCLTIPQTAWVTAVSPVAVQAERTMGPDQDRLACSAALSRLESTAEERCRVNYSGSSLYRNGRLLSLPAGRQDCACTSSSTHSTTCVATATAQCAHEVKQTRSVEICN